MTPNQTALAIKNKEEWNKLYGDTEKLVWGEEPIGFLGEFMDLVKADLDSSSRILEAATGEGRNLPLLVATGATVYASDASENALNKINPEIKKQVQPWVCDMTDLPFENDYFDFILATDVIETLPDYEKAVIELNRVLRRGGRFVVNIPGMEDGVAGLDMTQIGERRFMYQDRYFYQFLDEAEGIALLEKNGFKILENRVCQWWEKSHTDYREADHSHTSRVFLAEKI